MKFNKSILDSYIGVNSKFCFEKHPEADLYIYGYDTRRSGDLIKWDNMNMNMRGLIIDSLGNVQATAFKKFFTFKKYLSSKVIQLSEGNTLKLPNERFHIGEKLDGTMGLLYWCNGLPYIATQRSFLAPNALKASQILHKKYSHLFPLLNRSYSYVFEVIFQDSRVLVDYGNQEDIVLIGVIDNNTGHEITNENLNIGFPVAKDFTKQYGHISDLSELKSLNLPNLEGFVLSYPESGIKLKLKFPWFDAAHDEMNNIIHMSQEIRRSRNKLHKLMNHEPFVLTNTMIWNAIKTEGNINRLLSKIPYDYYFHNLEQWLDVEINNCKKAIAENMHLNIKEPCSELIQPQKICSFLIEERLAEPRHSTVMWKFFERELQLFH